MGAGKSGFESTNNIGESKSQRLPSDDRSLGSSTIDSTSIISGGIGGKSFSGAVTRDEAWAEYVDTLKDSLTESKEFVASITSSQDTLMRETKEERKQMKLLMTQHTKLMSMLESNIIGKGGSRKKIPGRRKGKKQKPTCKHYRKDGYHEDDKCFSLPEDVHLCPDWYKK